ncbi:hypothetical protein [Streptomyces bullii]|uniref:hypothetical protein n=1 Tax=Streptomyces bullii TaxID=349910 RepID=UPI0036D24C75
MRSAAAAASANAQASCFHCEWRKITGNSGETVSRTAALQPVEQPSNSGSQ